MCKNCHFIILINFASYLTELYMFFKLQSLYLYHKVNVNGKSLIYGLVYFTFISEEKQLNLIQFGFKNN